MGSISSSLLVLRLLSGSRRSGHCLFFVILVDRSYRRLQLLALLAREGFFARGGKISA
jgi:hypothetical protein